MLFSAALFWGILVDTVLDSGWCLQLKIASLLVLVGVPVFCLGWVGMLVDTRED